MSSTQERPRMPGSPIDKILARGVTEGRPVGNELVRKYPSLNSHPRIRHDGTGRLYVFTDHLPVGTRGWMEFNDVESALNAKPIIMDRHDRKSEDIGTRMEGVMDMAGTLSRQFRAHVLEEDAAVLDRLAAKVIVDGKFSDVSAGGRAKIHDKVLLSVGNENAGGLDVAHQFTTVGRLMTELVYDQMVEVMAQQPQKGVVEVLSMERAVERFILEQAASYTEHVSTLMPGKGTPLRNALPLFELFFRRNVSDQVMRLKPYSDVAVWARLSVLGSINSGISRETLESYFGKKDVAGLLSSVGPLRHYTIDRARGKKLEIASTMRRVLDQGDVNLRAKE